MVKILGVSLCFFGDLSVAFETPKNVANGSDIRRVLSIFPDSACLAGFPFGCS